MTVFSKKALLATALIGGLVAAPIVYAAGSQNMPGDFMGQNGFQHQGGERGQMMGGMGMQGAMMGGAMMGNENMAGQMPAMSDEQLSYMTSMLANLSDEQRAFVEKRMAEHGITLPGTDTAPATK